MLYLSILLKQIKYFSVLNMCYQKLKPILSENAMKSITRIEEMIMLAILNLGDDAYLVSIQAYLSEIFKKKVSLTSV